MKTIRPLSCLAACFALAGLQDAAAGHRFNSHLEFSEPVDGLDADFIFGGSMEQTNGATSCASATRLGSATTNVADTTGYPDWITALGPIPSPASDAIYSFRTGPTVSGSIVPIATDFDFVIYVIPDCGGTAVQPAPIAATSAIGDGIDLAAAGLVTSRRYYLVVTAIPAAGAAATGFVRFTAPPTLAIDTGP